MSEIWHDARPCPQWCANGAEHLRTQVKRGMDGFWHTGEEIDSPTDDVDHNWRPLPVRLHLLQKEQVDERGHHRHPVQVSVNESTLTTDQARALAHRLLGLADEADKHPRDPDSPPE